MMRMEDGNIILLSVGLDTTKVFVTPRLDSIASFTELASFPFSRLHKDRRAKEDAILYELRKAIGWPKSTDDLRQTLSGLGAIAALL